MPKPSLSGRFALQDKPVSQPGKCGICGATGSTEPSRAFLDTRLDFDFYGVLIFCDECIGEMARCFEWCSPGQLSAEQAKVEALSAELILLKTRLQHTEAYIASVFSVDPASGVLTGESAISESGDSLDPSGDSDSENVTGIGTSDESEDVAPSDEQGRDDLRNSDVPRFVAGALDI